MTNDYEELEELNRQARLAIRRIEERRLSEAAVSAGIASPWEPPEDRDDSWIVLEEDG